jgi:hypothetical protein
MSTETIIDNIMCGLVGGLVVALSSHFLTKDRDNQRDKKTSEQAAANVKTAKRREFLNLIIEVKVQIEMENNPGVWVNHFTDNVVPTLLSEFKKLSKDLSSSEHNTIEAALIVLVGYSKNGGADVYANKISILESLEKLSKI